MGCGFYKLLSRAIGRETISSGKIDFEWNLINFTFFAGIRTRMKCQFLNLFTKTAPQ